VRNATGLWNAKRVQSSFLNFECATPILGVRTSMVHGKVSWLCKGVNTMVHGTSKLSISGTQMYFCEMLPTDTALVLAALLLSTTTRDSRNLESVPAAT
jgi:hypothetical protein